MSQELEMIMLILISLHSWAQCLTKQQILEIGMEIRFKKFKNGSGNDKANEKTLNSLAKSIQTTSIKELLETAGSWDH